MSKIKFVLFLLPAFFIFPFFVSAANIDPILKYAWGDKLGWVNFNPDGGDVIVSALNITGSAWSANYGWINLSPDSAGVKNDGQGNLTGHAWSENLGWLDFSGVKIENGLFAGQASGDKAGTLNFSCDHCAVTTTWRKTGSTGSAGIVPVYPQSAAIDLPISKNELLLSSNSSIVNIPLLGDADVKSLSYSLTGDFTNESIIPFQNNLSINICPTGNCPSGIYEVWLKFFSATGHSLSAQKISINYQAGSTSSCSNDREIFLEIEKSRLGKSNLSLNKRLSGRILLQTEDRGRAWYVYPKNLERYYLGCPSDAFEIMRNLSLGISNKNFDSLSLKDRKRLSGIILLKVEDHGRAYYINPVDLKLHFLGRPDDARNIMRELALGISNSNLGSLKLNSK